MIFAKGKFSRTARIARCVLFSVSLSLAGTVSTSGLSSGGSAVRDLQLREFGTIFRPGVEGYVALNLYYFPLPGQARLSTGYGKHEGYVLRQNFAGYFAEELGKSGWDLGALWWIERHGWDSEDFVLFPHYGKFSLVRSVQTAGFSLANPDRNFGVAAGIQYTNPEYVGRVYAAESDSLFEWAAAVLGPVSFQTSFHHSEFRHARISLNLESKEILRGKSSGPATYLPNLDVAFYSGKSHVRDSVRIFWEQNLLMQRLYGEAAFYFPDRAFRYFALKYYPDPSKVVSIDVTCFRKENGDLLFGGGLTMPFFRIAYNHTNEIENVFSLRGTLVVQFHFGIERIFEKFIAPGGSRSSPMITRDIETDENVKKQRRDEREAEFKASRAKGKSESAPREITAKGIVRENAK